MPKATGTARRKIRTGATGMAKGSSGKTTKTRKYTPLSGMVKKTAKTIRKGAKRAK